VGFSTKKRKKTGKPLKKDQQVPECRGGGRKRGGGGERKLNSQGASRRVFLHKPFNLLTGTGTKRKFQHPEVVHGGKRTAPGRNILFSGEGPLKKLGEGRTVLLDGLDGGGFFQKGGHPFRPKEAVGGGGGGGFFGGGGL